MLMRILSFFVIAGVVAFATQTFFGSELAAAADESIKAVSIQDHYSDDVHEISGMVMVPSPCHDLTVRTKDVDANTTAIIFETWEQPYRACEQELTPKAFKVVVFAPENIVFKAILDNEWVRLAIVK